jgi:hypothetical protein
VRDVGSEEVVCVCMEVFGNSILSAQFFCDPKVTLAGRVAQVVERLLSKQQA